MTPDALLVVGVAAGVLARQFTARPVRAATAYAWAVLLVARGCVPPGPARTTAAGVAFLVAGLAVSAAAGYLRGRTVPLWRDAQGRLHRKGDRTTLLVWLATAAAKLALTVLAAGAFADPFAPEALWLGLGLTLAVEQATITSTRRVPEGQPHSTVHVTCT